MLKLGEDYKETQGSELCMHDAGSSAELQFKFIIKFTRCKHFFNSFRQYSIFKKYDKKIEILVKSL